MAQKCIRNDFKLLSFIAEFKFLTVRQLSILSQRTSQVVRRRLRSLKEEGSISIADQGLGVGSRINLT